MPVNRKLWQSRVSHDDVPNWPCPKCGAASLIMVKDSFLTVEDSRTAQNKHDQDFEPDSPSGRFVCLLACTKSACRETCAVSGNYDTWQDHNEHGEWLYASGRPTAITPPPPMIHVPATCPAPIREEVFAAFSLFWIDYSSSLNRIRNAIELLLTKMGIKRFGKKKTGGRSIIALDGRIQILRNKKVSLGDLCDRLLAVKHLGNAGSHPGDATESDVFDGLDIVEQVLNEIYEKHASVLAKMVKQINARKGPRKGK
jgi:hypothetical protein